MLNTAVIGVNKRLNPSIIDFYSHFIKSYQDLKSLANSFNAVILSWILKRLNNGTIYNYPPLRVLNNCDLFDSAWLCFDGKVPRKDPTSICGFKEFTEVKFANESDFDAAKFFPGSFTYHLHLDHTGPFVKNNSYFHHFEKFYSSIFK